MEKDCTKMTPLGAAVRGLIAGAVGTLVMDLVWYRRYKRGGGESPFLNWESAASLTDWQSAPAPAKLGKHLYEGVFQRELPSDRARLTTNVMHWGYGTTWSTVYGIVAGSLRRPSAVYGLPFGALVWATSYVILPLAKLYKPLWEYDTSTLLKDATAHLAYGTGTSAAFALLAHPKPTTQIHRKQKRHVDDITVGQSSSRSA
jgi:hypothetical protein